MPSTPTSASAAPTSDEDAIRSGIPVGRTATTREVASAIAYLCGEDAAYLTGLTLDINGGSHLH